MSAMDTSVIHGATGEMQSSTAPAQTGEAVARAAGSQASALVLALQRLFSFPVMLGAMLVTGAFFAVRGFNVDPDLWWHLKSGQNILTTHHWPTSDSYSFTVAGQPWLSFEWLGDVLFAAVAQVAGVQGLEALLVVLSACIIIALYSLCSLRSGNSKAGFLAMAALLGLATTNFNLRPQMLGYLFLVLLLIVLELFRQGKRGPLCFLPLLFLAWINAHGSWVVGLATMAVYWASGLRNYHLGGIEMRPWAAADRLRLALAFLFCLAVLPMTPYRTELAAYPFQVASALPVNIANISEWEPMPFDQIGGKVFLILILGFFALQAILKLKWRLEELTLLFFGTAMACIHVRFLLIFVPLFAPLLATIISKWLPPYDSRIDRPVFNAVLMFSLLALIARSFPSRANIGDSIAKHYPVEAVNYLREHEIAGPMFNSYGFGGYLVWALGPERKVFIDGRGELYEVGGVLADYMHIALLKPGALSVLKDYGIRACLVDRHEPLANVLAVVPEWRLTYSDQVSVLFERRVYAEGAATKLEQNAVGREVDAKILRK